MVKIQFENIAIEIKIAISFCRTHFDEEKLFLFLFFFFLYQVYLSKSEEYSVLWIFAIWMLSWRNEIFWFWTPDVHSVAKILWHWVHKDREYGHTMQQTERVHVKPLNRMYRLNHKNVYDMCRAMRKKRKKKQQNKKNQVNNNELKLKHCYALKVSHRGRSTSKWNSWSVEYFWLTLFYYISILIPLCFVLAQY